MIYPDDYVNKILQGDCLELMKGIPENSVDAVITDPPAGISFMGKEWDTFVHTGEYAYGNKELMAFQEFIHMAFKEVIRVLKPGGHAFVWAIPRTSHHTAMGIERAGFEIRDCVYHVFGSGFPKSLNIGKSVNQLETNEWLKISKALDNIDQKSIMEVWKTNAKPAGIQLSKSLTEVGSNTPKKFFVPDIAVLYSNQKNELLNAIIAEMRLKGLSLILEEDGIIAVENAGQTIELLPENARLAVKLSESPNHKSWSIFTAQCDVKEWLNENTEVNHKVDEALKTLRGNKKYSNEEITSVLCAVIPSVLKLTILNQSKTFQNLDTNQKMECASAINVIITEYTAENLISNTVAILKSKAVDKLQGNEREIVREEKEPLRQGGNVNWDMRSSSSSRGLTKGTSEWEGWGTALKPAVECWWLCRKPLSEKSVAENCIKWGTGGINIDESRVGTEVIPAQKRGNSVNTDFMSGGFTEEHTGRFPANLILSFAENEYIIKENITNEQKQKALKWIYENA